MVSPVQLWTMNNYHWYLKQHIVFPGEMDICGFHWDSESPLCAHIADSSKSVLLIFIAVLY